METESSSRQQLPLKNTYLSRSLIKLPLLLLLLLSSAVATQEAEREIQALTGGRQEGERAASLRTHR